MAFEPLAGLNLPVEATPGSPPEFAAALPAAPFAMAGAAAHSLLTAGCLGLSGDITSAVAEVKALLNGAAEHLKQLAAADCVNGASFEEATAAIRLLVAYEKSAEIAPGATAGLGGEIAYLRSQLVAYFTCLFQHPEILTPDNEVRLLEAINLLMVREAKSHLGLPIGFETLRPPALSFILGSLEPRLTESGIDPVSGVVTNESLLLGMTLERNESVLAGMLLRKSLLTLSDSLDTPLPYAPGANAHEVIDEALHHLVFARRHLLILAARANLAAFPSGRGIANHNGYIDPRHPLIPRARAHAREARLIAEARLQLEVLVQRLGGTGPRPGEIYIESDNTEFVYPGAGTPGAAAQIRAFGEREIADRIVTVVRVVNAEDFQNPDTRDSLRSKVWYDPPGPAPPPGGRRRTTSRCQRRQEAGTPARSPRCVPCSTALPLSIRTSVVGMSEG